ncbi:MAG: hypothetical protein ACQETI_14975 [Halobacteriota archaeon]
MRDADHSAPRTEAARHSQIGTERSTVGRDRSRRPAADGGIASRESAHGPANGSTATDGQPGGDPGLRRLLRAYGLVAVAGAFVFWAPFLFTGSGWILLTGPALGGGIAFLAAVNAYRGAAGHAPSLSVSGLLVVLGVGAAASPVLLELDADLVFGTTALAGALAAVLAAYTVVVGWRRRS